MSKIRGSNTEPELRLRALLAKSGIRGYETESRLSGKPDLVFPEGKVAVFVDGCFWHKCPIHFIEPRTRKNFWIQKVNGNAVRDRETDKKLRDQGWEVVRFWEHEVYREPGQIVTSLRSLLERRQGFSSEQGGSFGRPPRS